MNANKSLVIRELVIEHVDESTFLWVQRTYAIHAPNYSPVQFTELDERLAASIDGLRVAGTEGWMLAEAALENEGPEDFFPAAVLALEAQDEKFDELVERAIPAPAALPGLMSALGWASYRYLTERIPALISDDSPIRQKLGLAASAYHRQDPGQILYSYLSSPVDSVRIRALRIAGELARQDTLPQLMSALDEAKPEARFWAARSAVLLGNRTQALDVLANIALEDGSRQVQALQLALQAMDIENGTGLLKKLAALPDTLRLTIIGSGYLGNARNVPWLIEQMEKPLLARVAAEAFVNITGADFNLDQLESMPPEAFEEPPTEDPDDEIVELPEDIALPWPDIVRIHKWWGKHQGRFQNDECYFLGQPPAKSHCINVLKEGYQRQRIAASQYLSLLHPGTPLFPTTAPAWRQKRWMEELVVR